VLKVTVFGVPELTRDVTVDADGTFDFPYIGRVKAAGETVRAIQEELKARLSKGLLTNPSVSVDVGAYRSQTVYIMGEVRNPGRTVLTANQTIMSVLAEAGFLPSAGPYVLISHRSGPGEGPSIPDDKSPGQVRLSRKDLEMGRVPAIRLQDGDTIFVPKAEQFFITGQVRQQGFFTLERDLTVLQALALAGGATEKAATNRIQIQRVENGKQVTIKAKLTDLVRPGDTIVVPQRYF
jgi:polysaccharide export outer membrane protein